MWVPTAPRREFLSYLEYGAFTMTQDEQQQLRRTFLSVLRTPDADVIRRVAVDDVVWSFAGSSAISGIAHGVDGVIRRARTIAAHTGTLLLAALGLICMVAARPATAQSDPSTAGGNGAALADVNALYRDLIDAENRHDLAAVRKMVWDSPSALFVAKTARPEQGNWAGFWGIDTVVRHLGELYEAGPFRIDPDYGKVKTVSLTDDVAETYAPVKITVAYAGQTPVPKPFLMILNWVHGPSGWKMATDIALPVPPVQAQAK